MGAVMSLSISPLSPILQFMVLSFVSTILVILIPYTKVEESFQMHAIHDYLTLSSPKRFIWVMSGAGDGHAYDTINNITMKWDHEHYPGVVRRTFIGPFAVSLLVKPLAYQLTDIENGKYYTQILSRVALSLMVITAFSSFGAAVQLNYGATTRRALSVLTLTQFHFLFYCSRSLPNTFALIIVLYGCGQWLRHNYRNFIISVAICVIIFRTETALLFGWIIIYELLITRDLKLLYLLKIGIPAGVGSLMATILFDSYMWGHWIYPEGDGIWFNIYNNQSHEFGTSPLLWYFYSALPRALLMTLIFVPFCCKEMLKTLLSVSLLFVATYSLLPHKELRFIIYCIPLLNACAANTIAVVIEKFEDHHKENYKRNESFLINLLWNYLYPNDGSSGGDSVKNGTNCLRDDNKYDAIPQNNRNLRRRAMRGVQSAYGYEQELDDAYEKITAAQLQITNDKCSATPNGWCMTLAFVLMAIHVWCNVAATVFMSLAAWHNYPGGEAVSWANRHIIEDLRNNSQSLATIDNNHIGMYVCNLAAQTGFTRFLELDGVYYNKEPKLIDSQFAKFAVTYLILEKSDVQSLQSQCTGTGTDVSCHIGKYIRNCRILKSVTGFNGLDFSLSKQVVIKTIPMIWIFRCQK